MDFPVTPQTCEVLSEVQSKAKRKEAQSQPQTDAYPINVLKEEHGSKRHKT